MIVEGKITLVCDAKKMEGNSIQLQMFIHIKLNLSPLIR